jgi:hypothetical protein
MSDSFVETGDQIKIQDDNSMYMGRKKKGGGGTKLVLSPNLILTWVWPSVLHLLTQFQLQSKSGMKLEGQTRAQRQGELLK